MSTVRSGSQTCRAASGVDAPDMLSAMLADVGRFNAGTYEDDATLILAAM